MSKVSRPMTKSPLQLAQAALRVARSALATYSCKKSNHLYTQPQLFAILVLRDFFKTDYRGIAQILKDSSDLCNVLGLKEVPHFTTLQKAQARFLKKRTLTNSSTSSPNVLALSA